MFPERIRKRIRSAIWGGIKPDSRVARMAECFAIVTLVVLVVFLLGGLASQFLFGVRVSEAVSTAIVVLLAIFMFGQVIYLRSQGR